MVKANDCMKNKVTGCYTMKPILDIKTNQKKKGSNLKEETKPILKQNKTQMTKLERKQKYKELKQTLNQEWSTKMETEDTGSEELNAPSHFKCYTMEERKVILQNPMRESQGSGKSYNGPKNSKQINLAEDNEEPRKV